MHIHLFMKGKKKMTNAIEKIYSLTEVYRWNGTANQMADTVAQHSYCVTCLCLMIAEVYPENIDEKDLMLVALYHDIAEADIAHITYGAKKCSAILKKEVNDIKETLFKTWSKQRGFSYITENPKMFEMYKEIIEFADNLDACIHCKQEVEMGNQKMQMIYLMQKEKLLQKVKNNNWAGQFYTKYLTEIF